MSMEDYLNFYIFDVSENGKSEGQRLFKDGKYKVYYPTGVKTVTMSIKYEITEDGTVKFDDGSEYEAQVGEDNVRILKWISGDG